jgi:hypothetical protein
VFSRFARIGEQGFERLRGGGWTGFCLHSVHHEIPFTMSRIEI